MENIGPTSWVCNTSSKKLNINLPDFETIWNLKPENKSTITLFGKTHEVPRWHKNYGYDYKFNGMDRPAESVPPEIEDVINQIKRKILDDFNGILINWYSPEDYIAFHSDSEKQLDTTYPILTLTLSDSESEKRKFVVKSDTDTRTYHLGHGDIFIMGGDTQKTHKHGLPRSKKYSARRISITFRKFVT